MLLRDCFKKLSGTLVLCSNSILGLGGTGYASAGCVKTCHRLNTGIASGTLILRWNKTLEVRKSCGVLKAWKGSDTLGTRFVFSYFVLPGTQGRRTGVEGLNRLEIQHLTPNPSSRRRGEGGEELLKFAPFNPYTFLEHILSRIVDSQRDRWNKRAVPSVSYSARSYQSSIDTLALSRKSWNSCSRLDRIAFQDGMSKAARRLEMRGAS